MDEIVEGPLMVVAAAADDAESTDEELDMAELDMAETAATEAELDEELDMAEAAAAAAVDELDKEFGAGAP